MKDLNISSKQEPVSSPDSPTSEDPIFKEDGKWWFWDETWSGKYGPFESDEDCKNALIDYADRL